MNQNLRLNLIVDIPIYGHTVIFYWKIAPQFFFHFKSFPESIIYVRLFFHFFQNQHIQEHQQIQQNHQQNNQNNQHLQQIQPTNPPAKMGRGKHADGKPRGRMTAYAFFVQTCREEHKKKHPEEQVVFAEFSRKCAERWKVSAIQNYQTSTIFIIYNV